ncbi:MAG: dTDP-4-dehydrorhamnose reductase [Candidatus Uhrbacteria bacterium]
MRVVIIGAKGMLGQELVRVFEDADVSAWNTTEVDITDAVAVRDRIGAARPQIIINAAAYNAVDRAEEEPEVANQVNGAAVGYIAEAAAEVGATFVHYSTDYVFDGTKTGGYEEQDEPNPISAYGRSKRAGEDALRAVVAAHPNLPWYLIRTSRLFGAPASSLGAKRSFVDTMVALSRTRDRIEVINEEVSSPTYVVDLAAATRAILDHKLSSGIYHRTNDGACTWFDFAQEIFRVIGWRGELTPIPASAYPRPACRPALSILQTTKLPPLRRWEDALTEYLQNRKS